MPKSLILLSFTVAALLFAGGCVVRELSIKSDPPGASVYINGRPEGRTPFKKEFDFYGSREIVLRLDGYKSEKEVVSPGIPWYEYFPIDFISEIILPFTIRDVHEYSFKLSPLPDRPSENLLKRAGNMRAQARGEEGRGNGGSGE